ncbi:GNAT family N-acetyltransferase [Candidatus Gracilibacteria bacterium]|nr:GNAT family N-acetyltransferase [Candidatus Gracilibacteria bacterium]
MNQRTMRVLLRTAVLADAAFLTDVVISATFAQGRFPDDIDLAEYRTGFEEWTRETVLGNIPHCTLSVIEYDGIPIGRLRVLRDGTSITLAGIQLLPDYQNKGIGTTLVEQLKQEANLQHVPLYLSVEKDNPNALRFYGRLGCIISGEDEKEYNLEYHPRDSDIQQ